MNSRFGFGLALFFFLASSVITAFCVHYHDAVFAAVYGMLAGVSLMAVLEWKGEE